MASTISCPRAHCPWVFHGDPLRPDHDPVREHLALIHDWPIAVIHDSQARCDKCGTPKSEWRDKPVCESSLVQSSQHTITRFYLGDPNG